MTTNLTPEQIASQAPTPSREAFERAAPNIGYGLDLTRSRFAPESYNNYETIAAWDAWQTAWKARDNVLAQGRPSEAREPDGVAGRASPGAEGSTS